MTDTKIDAIKKDLTSATSAEEDAILLAELIHTLGLTLRSMAYEDVANARLGDEPFFQPVMNGGSMTTRLVYEDDGEAKDDEGKPCRSVGQHRKRLDGHLRELWQRADDEGNRRLVEEKLQEIQRLSAQRMMRRAGDDPSGEG